MLSEKARELGAQPANPWQFQSGYVEVAGECHRGITIRMDFAKAAMQGIRANEIDAEMTTERIAAESFAQADAMLEFMAKEEPNHAESE